MDKKNTKRLKISRRGFIRSSAAAAIGLGAFKKTDLFGQNTQDEAPKRKILEYRTLGRTGFKASDISLGAGNMTNEAVLAAALDAGINYIDTAEHYLSGNSERTIGKVMKSRDRKSVFITTKLNLTFWKASREAIKDRFHKCLERLQMDYVDCLMIHMASTVEQVKHEAYHEVVNELKTEGKVRFTGLSNHGTEHKLAGKIKEPMEKVFLAAVDDGRFDVTLFVHNFIQKEQGEQIIKACKSKNMGTTLMKTDPVKFYSDIETMFEEAKEKGREIPESTIKMMEEYKSHIAKADEFRSKYKLTNNAQVHDAAIKFCLNNPDVHAVCPTMNSFEELEAHLKLSGQRLMPVEASMLTDYETTHGQFYCRHACGVCESSCPVGVPVNTIMRYDHYFRAQRREKAALEKYAGLHESKADTCVDCVGYCEKACPYGVPIQGLLTLAHQTLTI